LQESAPVVAYFKNEGLFLKLQRSLVFLPLFLFLLSGIGVLYLLWFKLDFLYVDIAGHLASAKSFSEGYFQSFNEHFFTGLVQNLFYPPIEDLILSVFTKLIRLSDTHAYLLYMSIVMSAFFYLLYRLTESFKNIAAKSFCSFSLLLLFFAQKEDVMFFQGLGGGGAYAQSQTHDSISQRVVGSIKQQIAGYINNGFVYQWWRLNFEGKCRRPEFQFANRVYFTLNDLLGIIDKLVGSRLFVPGEPDEEWIRQQLNLPKKAAPPAAPPPGVIVPPAPATPPVQAIPDVEAQDAPPSLIMTPR
jgi:hypothetical protein